MDPAGTRPTGIAIARRAQLCDPHRPEPSSTECRDLLVLLARERGRLRESGAAYDVHFVYEFTFRDDKVSYIRELAVLSRD
jgi:hypothetical protein